MMLRKTLRLLKISTYILYRRVPYIFVFSVSLLGLAWVSSQAYYRYAPASWFLHIQGTPAITSGPINSTLTITFCRNTRYANISAVGARSYYMIANGQRQPAGDYSFKAVIEHTDGCQYIPLPPNKHPGKAGTYLSHTELTFYVNGHRKVVSYDSSSFRLSDTADSLQQQINDLQSQLKELQSRSSSFEPPQAGQTSQVAQSSARRSGSQQTGSTQASGSSSAAGGTPPPASNTPAPTIQGGLSGLLIQTVQLTQDLLPTVLK